MITFSCPMCSRRCEVPDKLGGQATKCPACGNLLVLLPPSPPPNTPHASQPATKQRKVLAYFLCCIAIVGAVAAGLAFFTSRPDQHTFEQRLKRNLSPDWQNANVLYYSLDGDFAQVVGESKMYGDKFPVKFTAECKLSKGETAVSATQEFIVGFSGRAWLLKMEFSGASVTSKRIYEARPDQATWLEEKMSELARAVRKAY